MDINAAYREVGSYRAAAIADIADGSKLDPDPGTLVVADLTTRVVKRFRGTFDRFGIAAWSADGRHVAVGAPFEPKSLFVASLGADALERIPFRRHVPSPLIDAELLEPR